MYLIVMVLPLLLLFAYNLKPIPKYTAHDRLGENKIGDNLSAILSSN